MEIVLETMSVKIPRSEVSFFRELAEKMGWTVQTGLYSEDDDLPCRMTVEELRAEVRESVKDAEKGLGITVEQARTIHPRI
jgi:hypothetical protein